ncbi:MAG TPA: response regulator [Azospirillaceae bacterium]|nr:response regulator [Azospirillaceae bacterium]
MDTVLETEPASASREVRILLLEDSPLDADLVREHIARMPMRLHVDHVTHREDFSDALHRRRYDVILADYVLPSFSGDAALDLAIELAPRTPFIFVSGTLGEDVAVESMKRGATDYVLKSRLQRLPVAVNRALAEAREREELTRTESALAASEARLRLALEAGGLGSFEIELGTGRVLRTLRHDQILGYRALLPEWNYGALLAHVLPEDRERLDTEFRHAVAARADWHSQCRVCRADGAVRWLELWGNPVADGTRMHGIIADITDRQEAEAALRQLNGTLEQRVTARTAELADTVNRLNAEILRREGMETALLQAQKMDAIGQMTGGVAHDFNNLLTVLVSHLDLIQHAATDPGRVRQLASAALDAADRGVRLTGHLLAFARRQALRPQTVSVNRLVQNFEPLIRRALGEAVSLVSDLADSLPACHIDPTQFEVAMLNLAVNARDAMPGGGGLSLRTRLVRLDAAQLGGQPDAVPGEFVEVTVADTGVGIPPEVLNRVFEPFFTTKDVGRGSGLGLSQVYGFARQSGGFARIESERGQGTRVTIYLPRAAGEALDAIRQDHGDPSRHYGRGELILVVEDDPLVRAATSETIRELGYRVVTAASGHEGLVRLEEGRPDLLFSDVIMPGMNGPQLAEEARRRFPGLPVLLASGYTGPESGEPGADSAAFPLLNKPYRRGTLGQMLRQLLDAANRDKGSGTDDAAPAAPRTLLDRPLRILLVEDELLIRMSCATMLADLGHDVTEAMDADAATRALEAPEPFDLLLTDIGLPGLPGTELARRTRERFPDLWIVYASGRPPEEEELVADGRRVLFLPKPYRQEDLERVILTVAGS